MESFEWPSQSFVEQMKTKDDVWKSLNLANEQCAGGVQQEVLSSSLPTDRG
jgi:hypothetical protein